MAEGAEDVPVVYLHEIKRQYTQGEATLTILDGAKLALWAGQSVALVAPSGSGKSTLLHIAGLLESPDDGEVYVGGAPTSQLSDIDRTQIRRTDIGFVYQQHRLLPGDRESVRRHTVEVALSGVLEILAAPDR
jgi:lipoprotein-releasing system ATP-binding protein